MNSSRIKLDIISHKIHQTRSKIGTKRYNSKIGIMLLVNFSKNGSDVGVLYFYILMKNERKAEKLLQS